MLPGQHSIPLMALKGLLDEVGIKLPMYKVRDIIERLKENNETDNGETLSKSAFEKVCELLLNMF